MSFISSYYNIISVIFIISIIADSILAVLVVRNEYSTKPLYPYCIIKSVIRNYAFRLVSIIIFVISINDKSIGATGLDFIAIFYVIALFKSFYEVIKKESIW